MVKLINTKWIEKNILKRLTIEHKQVVKKAGMPPGSVVYVGNKNTPKFQLDLIEYVQQEITEKPVDDISTCAEYLVNQKNSWVNAIGIDHIKQVQDLGDVFGLHALMLEDLVNTQHRPKMEIYEDHLFVAMKMLSLYKSGDVTQILQEQVSLVLGKSWMITFQEQEGDVFDGVRNRLRDDQTQLRKKEIDYLFYRLIDTLIDNYFLITEHISDSIESLEEELIINLHNDIRWKIQSLRKDLIQIRKAVSPLREVIGNLSKDENPFIKKSTRRFLYDVYEHILQLNDYIDTQRDLLSSLSDLYNSGISNRMNQVMMVLTVMASIFIPLTFIAGIYGMNFDNMPELHTEYGYYIVWGVMIAIGLGMLLLFKLKKWL